MPVGAWMRQPFSLLSGWSWPAACASGQCASVDHSPLVMTLPACTSGMPRLWTWWQDRHGSRRRGWPQTPGHLKNSTSVTNKILKLCRLVIINKIGISWWHHWPFWGMVDAIWVHCLVWLYTGNYPNQVAYGRFPNHGWGSSSSSRLCLMFEPPCKMYTVPKLIAEPKLEPQPKPRFGKGPMCSKATLPEWSSRQCALKRNGRHPTYPPQITP